MTKKITSFFILFFLFFTQGFSQSWVKMMQDPNANFYQTVDTFNTYWAGKTIEKGKGYKTFRRWQEYMEPRVYPKGDVKQAARAYEEFQKWLIDHPVDDLGERAAGWVPLGPTGAPIGGGAGRINAIRFDPTNSNIVYACTPAGGLWKSTNSGTTWSSNTDQLAVLGCTDIAIDPTNTNIMYLATGDGEAGDTYSIGVLKTTDGGTTWNPTGLSWTVSQGITISKLLINPGTPTILIAATNAGIYRTTNSGTSWTLVQTGNFKDAEFKPTDPTTVYASGTDFYLSTNSGLTFSQITSGVPAATTNTRLAIGVTPADPTYVYILASDNSYGFLGFYRSTNSGTTFATRSTTPNILGYSSTGSGTGGQGWYDLAVDVSETNRDVVIVGGVNIWRSTNGGTSWTINAHWTGTGAPYVHADIHDLTFLPGSGATYWAGCDGGVFRTTSSGTSWSDLSSNLQIAQQYRVGLSATTSNLLVTGHQDNGTNKMSGSTWSEIYGGDGLACFIDRTNDNNIFAAYVYGDYQRSTTGGASWTNIVTGLTGTAAWLAPWQQDPVTATTLYCGYQNLFKSTNSGTTWTSLAALPGTGSVVEFKVAPSNVNYIYVLKSNAVYKTINGGTSWTTVTSTLPVASAALTNIEVCPTDPLKVWVTFSGYSSGNKVYYTSNGGTSWSNYSTGLPNLPHNCILYQNSTADGLYVGTDVGVYYRDNTLSSWQPYFTGLPNVIVRDLEIFYGTGKLRAATFGRGTWETDLFSPGTSAPVADFTSDRQVICAGQTVNFTDLSTFSPTSWAWTFAGGIPATSTLQNPSVVFNTPGTYTVTLVATNVNGSNTKTKTAYITVSTVQPLPVTEGFESVTFAPTNWFVKDANLNGLTWTRNGTLGAWGTSSACAMWDNYNNDDAGAKDELSTAKYDYTGVTTSTLTFDVAYARYNATYSDTLEVLVSTDCGITFTQVYIKGGTTLSTNGGVDLTTLFTPTSSQWRNESVSLTAYAGQPDVMVVFRNHAHYGNAIYVDNVNITATFTAPPVADYTASSTSVCAGSTVTFTNISTGASGYSWTFPGGTPGTSTATNPTVTYSTPGTYNVTLVATGPGGSDTELKPSYITVVGAPTTANAGIDQTACEGSTVTMAGNSPTTGTGLWTKVSGPAGGTIATPTSASTTITALVPGTYVYQWTISNAPCTASSDQMTLTVNGLPTTANAGPDQTICNTTTTVTMAGNTAIVGTGTWTKISGPAGGTITTASSPTTTITGLVTGTYVYQWSIANAPCASSTDQMSIIVNAPPTAANAGPDQTICNTTTTVTMAGNTATVGTGTWTKISGPAGGTITTASSATTTITGLTTGTYVYQWTITNNPCTASTDQMSIIVNAPPTTANAGPDQTICNTTTTVTMAGNVPTTGTGAWTKISGPAGGTITAASSATTTITGLTTGTYVYQWTITNSPCTASTDQMSIIVNAPPTVANAGVDQTICTSAGGVTLAGNTAVAGTGTWTQVSGPASTITSPSSPTSTVTGMVTVGTYVYRWTISNNPCTATFDNMQVTVTAGPTTANAGPDQTICNTTTTVTMAGNVPAVGAGSWTKISGPAGGTITTPSSATTTITALVAGTYVYQWTIVSAPCPNSSDQMSIIVNAPPTTANAGPDQSICTSAAGVTLAGNIPTSGTGTWTQVSGPASTITTPSSASSTVTGMGTVGTYVYQWTITNSPCAASTDQISVTVTPGPTTANAGPDQTICNTTTTVTMAGNVPAIGTGTWTKVSGPVGGTITTPSSATTTVTALTTGTYVYQWTIASAPCPNSSDQMTIVVKAPPTVANAGPDQTICNTSSTVTMAGNTATVGAGAWTKVSGPAGGAITTASSATTTITGLTTGTYVYQWTITNSPCTASSDQMTILVNAPPTPSNAGPDQTICSSAAMATMAGNTPATGAGLWTQVSGPAGATITTASSPSTTITGIVAGTYVFQWTISNNPCTASSDQMTLVVNDPPTAAVAGADQTICSTTTMVTMTANTPTVGTGTWTQVSGPASTITTPSSPNTTVTGLTAGTYVYQWTIDNAPCTSSSDQVSIVVNDPPTTADAGLDQTVCGASGTFTLSGNAPVIGTGTWTQVSGPASTITTPSSPTSTITGLISGTYVYQWTIDNLPCASSSDQVTITVDAAVSANAGTDQTICENDSLQLTGSGGGTYSWSPPSGLTSTTISNPVAGPTTDIDYVLTVTNGSCTDADTVHITVNPAPPVPVVTQNMDTLCASPSSGYTYQWFFNGSPISGATSSCYVFTANGDYAVEITDGISCSSASATMTITTAGIDMKPTDTPQLTIYPNPNDGTFTVTLNSVFGSKCTVTVHNDVGQLVFTKPVKFATASSFQLNLHGVARGSYLLTVTDGAKRYAQRMIIE